MSRRKQPKAVAALWVALAFDDEGEEGMVTLVVHEESGPVQKTMIVNDETLLGIMVADARMAAEKLGQQIRIVRFVPTEEVIKIAGGH